VEDDSHFLFRKKLLGEEGSVRQGVVMVKLPGLFSPKFAHFHAVAAKRRSITLNSQFGLFGPVLRSTTTAVYMAAPVRYIPETIS
jgi:hypothetical protein